jgi:diadenosine tetraphosphatase ApaH/serine/threonine PP2A family protein phosphatase
MAKSTTAETRSRTHHPLDSPDTWLAHAYHPFLSLIPLLCSALAVAAGHGRHPSCRRLRRDQRARTRHLAHRPAVRPVRHHRTGHTHRPARPTPRSGRVHSVRPLTSAVPPARPGARHTLAWTETVRARIPSPSDTAALRIPDATPMLITRRTTTDTRTGRILALEQTRLSPPTTPSSSAPSTPLDNLYRRQDWRLLSI